MVSSRKSPSESPEAAEVVQMLDSTYAGPAWYGPPVKVALRGVDARTAAWKPADGRNSIWEIVLHLAQGRQVVMNRAGFRAIFPRASRTQWWPVLPDVLDEAHWRADLELLDVTHARIVEIVSKLSTRKLHQIIGNGKRSLRDQLVGLALHDAYHAGQIRLLSLLHEARHVV